MGASPFRAMIYSHGEGGLKTQVIAASPKTLLARQESLRFFLGIDHNWGVGPPLLFETMVFGGWLDGEQERCSTWDEAEAQHKTMVLRVKDSLG